MKYKFKVLVTWRLFINQLNKYKKILIDNKIKIDTIHTKQFLSEKDLLKVIKDYHGVVCGDDQFTKKVLTCEEVYRGVNDTLVCTQIFQPLKSRMKIASENVQRLD